VESDTEDEEIVEERDSVHLCIRIPLARDQGGPSAAEFEYIVE